MRFGIGATDSMWPKKRRIRLRVLKAVAILRPRRFKGGRKYPLLSRSSRPASRSPHPSQWATYRNGLLNKSARKRSPSGPAPLWEAGPAGKRLLELDLGAFGFQLRLQLLGIGLRHAILDGLRRAFDQVLGLLEAEAG